MCILLEEEIQIKEIYIKKLRNWADAIEKLDKNEIIVTISLNL